MDATRFVGSTCVVTGAAQGIGLETATARCRGGAVLAPDVHDASEDIDGVTWLRGDVPDPGDWAAVLEQAGQLDVLVSSARPVGAYETITDIDTEARDRVVTMMTKNVAATYPAQGIRVNSVRPGFIWTPMTLAQDSDISDRLAAETPMKRAVRAPKSPPRSRSSLPTTPPS